MGKKKKQKKKPIKWRDLAINALIDLIIQRIDRLNHRNYTYHNW